MLRVIQKIPHKTKGISMAQKQDKPTRSMVVGIRFNKEERQKISKQAKANGISSTAVIRMALKKVGVI